MDIKLKWLLKMAWRDAKASQSRLILFVASIVLGISAVVSIQLFSSNLKNNIKLQSKSLMGADYIIDSRQKPTPRAQAIIDSLQPDASEVNFVSMVAFPKNEGTKLVKVRAIKGDFPFYGKIETQPESATETYQDSGGALVDATLLLQFNIKPGDSIKVGKVTLPISGALKSIPGSTGISASVAPPVIIPYRFLKSTELLQFGSRKEYQFFYKASDTLNLKRLDEKIDPMLDAENSDLDTHTSTSERLGRNFDNVSKFLYLSAFIALLLGCIGIASSVQIYIKEKLQSIAILKCVGASTKQSFLIFLIQIAGIGVLGGFIGSFIGIGLQLIFPYILKAFLPFSLEISLSVQPILTGVLLGLFMSILFALLPLLKAWHVSPLQVLRFNEQESKSSKKARFIIFTSIFIFLFLFSFWLLEDILFTISFVGGTFITFSVLAGIALLSMKLIKSNFSQSFGFTTRQSLLNLFRPNNQTLVLVVAIGIGTFLISTLYFTKDILLAKTEIDQSKDIANIIILDVQTEQTQAIENQIKASDLDIISNIPLVTMRMHKIKDKLVSTIKQDSTTQIRNWVLNHEFRTTYRDTLLRSERITTGNWVSEVKPNKTIEISISDNLAEDANVEVGDHIVFNVQGVLMATKVASTREVDWGQMQINFNIVFPKGVLENAPQFNVVSTKVEDEQSSAKLQRDLVAKFPNVSVIDIRQVYHILEDIINKISWVINFMAFFSILTGIIVLIGSVRTSKYQRIKESVLLRTLGAKNKHILKITAFEYIVLGVLGSFVGILLALLSSFCLALFVFKEPFLPSPVPFIVFLPGITLLVLVIGLSNIQSVLKSSPLEVLRKEV